MKTSFTRLACLSAALSTAAVCAQAPSPDNTATPDATANTTKPVAWVYVSYAPDIKSSNTHKISGYEAWADGTMTAMRESPFNDDVGSMAVNGKYLIAASNASTYIETYRMEGDGVLKYVTRIDDADFNGDCFGLSYVEFDRTGSWLYANVSDATNGCDNTGVASFALNKSTGALNYLGWEEDGNWGLGKPPSFLGNDVDAYSFGGDCAYWVIYGYRRASNGMLNSLGALMNFPAPPASFHRYAPIMGVADQTNHLAVDMSPADIDCVDLPPQIATYSPDSSGNLVTTSTYSNMPTTLITGTDPYDRRPYDMRMSPSGKLLAVAGQQGLQIFHFNGANPVTHYTNLITTAPINQMFWDNANHLYAISQSTNNVFVFTITPTGWSQAPGSPHALPSPVQIIVQPLPRY